MSRRRRLVVSDRYFFVTCNRLRTRGGLEDHDFEILARVIKARREEHGFLLTAWVFLDAHWHAVIGVRYPQTISLVLESIKVSSTRLMNGARGEAGRLWQGRFPSPCSGQAFDRALSTVKAYHEKIEYIDLNPVRAGRVSKAEEWKWFRV